MTRLGRRLVLATLVMAPVLALHAGHLAAGRVPYLRDLSRTHFPFKQVAVERWRRGEPPEWNPAHGAGSPLLANANFFHFHPISLLFLVLPYPSAFSLALAALSAAGALGMAAWLRARGATPAAAALAGHAFALGGVGASSTNLYNLLASYSTVPWALWAAERLGAEPRPSRIPALALALAPTLLGGEPTAFGWALLFSAALALPLRPRPLLAGLAAAALAVALAAVQLFPLAAATAGSVRGRGFTLAGSTFQAIAPARLLELVRPFPWGDPTRPWDPGFTGASLAAGATPLLYSIYAGTAVAALAVLGLLAPGERRARLALAGLATLAVLLALGAHTPLYPALWRALPPLRIFRYPSKYLVALALAVAALAARGLDRLRPRLGPALTASLVAVSAAELLAVHADLVPGAPAELFTAPPPLAREVAGRRVYFQLERERWVSAETDRLAFHLDHLRRLVPPAGLPFGVGYVLDPDPDLLDSPRMAALGAVLHRSEANRERLLPMLAASFVIDPAGPVVRRIPGAVAYARVVPAEAVRFAGGPIEAARVLSEPDFDPGTAALCEAEVARIAPGSGRVRFLRRPRPERIEVDAEGPGLLVVAESLADGWRATLDGEAVPIAPANLAFLGVVLSRPGAQRVVFEYRAPGFRTGLAVSLAALVAAGLLGALDRRRAKPAA